MMHVAVHSQNVRGSIKGSVTWILSTINDPNCECTAILLQDIGLTGPEGPPLLRNALSPHGHHLMAHCSRNNKAKTVAIVVHASWQIRSVLRDSSGGLLGVVINKSNAEILIVSAYLPATLDMIGMPTNWSAEDKRPGPSARGEAHAMYATLLDWTKQYPRWLLGGDLNELEMTLIASTYKQKEREEDRGHERKAENRKKRKEACKNS